MEEQSGGGVKRDDFIACSFGSATSPSGDAGKWRGETLVMNFPKASKRFVGTGAIVVGALLAEFLVLEGTVGISAPSDRYSALSRLEIGVKGTSLHFITRNNRFTVVDLLIDHGSRREALVLREVFFCDREDGREGRPDATIKVEATVGKQVRWTFQEPGEAGDVVTNNLYRVKRGSNGETPNIYTYFSLVDGRKVRTNRSIDLSREELELLDISVAR
jgi:hypothetical protein